MNRRRFVYGLGAALFASGRALAAGPTLAVVCHPASGVTSLNRTQLDAIFRLRTQVFPSGARVAPVNLFPDLAERQEFDRAVMGLEPDEVERFWIDSKIRSGTSAPRALPSSAAVARFVGGERSAVGYLPASEADATLRIVAFVRNGNVVPA